MKRINAKTYNIIRVLALMIAAGALIYASYSLTISYLDYKKDEAKYAEINNMFQTEKADSSTGGLSFSSTNKKWKWDYKAMRKYNDEAIGYIKLDNSRIQYPIVTHDDNKFYLTHGPDKISNGAGAVFVDYRTNSIDGPFSIVYGHNMLDGSMFADLMKFRSKKYCKKHQVFDIYVGYKHYKYYVFSVFSAKKDNEKIYSFGFENESDYASWINSAISRSTYNFKRKPTAKDKVIMLSTCVDDYGNRQLVVLYRGEEVVD